MRRGESRNCGDGRRRYKDSPLGETGEEEGGPSEGGCSFLLWKSFQNGVHLLRNGRQRKLKLILQEQKEREKKEENENAETHIWEQKSGKQSLISVMRAAKEPFGKMMNPVILQKKALAG